MRFTTEIINTLNAELKNDGIYVTFQEVAKNNGIKNALTIKHIDADNRICPTIYEENYSSISDVLNAIRSIDRNANPNFNVEEFYNKDFILSNVIAEVVSKDSPITENAICSELLDLAIIYRVIINNDTDAMASFILTKQMAENLGISENELFGITKTYDGFTLRNLMEVMAQAMGVSADTLDDAYDMPQVFVVSNHRNMYGASVLASDYMNTIAEELGSDVLCIPSSIHEILVMKDDGSISYDELLEMNRAVNNDTSIMNESEVLTTAIYKYSTASGLSKVA